MDGLRDLINDSSLDRKFHIPPSSFTHIHISSTPSDHASFSDSEVPEQQLLAKVREASSSLAGTNDPRASFQLVCIPRNNWNISDNHTICISRPNFEQLLSHFGIQPDVSYFLMRYSYGFRHITRHTGNTHTFILGTLLYILIWSFDPVTLTTNAVALPLQGNHYGGGPNTVRELKTLLQRYKDHICSPRLLAFVASVQVSFVVDRAVDFTATMVRRAEIDTGHGAWRERGPSRRELNTDDILSRSKEVGADLTNLANDARHMDIVGRLRSFMLEEASWLEQTPAALSDQHKASEDFFRSNLPFLQDQAESAKQSALFLQQRLQTQSSVLFTLLTHKDATTSLKLANASQALAEASKQDSAVMRDLAVITQRDSSAMKTVSIMTMMFLPATFFAALFAVPSLQWSQTNVIGRNFWIYWAFTIPATVLVFLVWAVLINWSHLMRKLARRSKVARSNPHEAKPLTNA